MSEDYPFESLDDGHRDQMLKKVIIGAIVDAQCAVNEGTMGSEKIITLPAIAVGDPSRPGATEAFWRNQRIYDSIITDGDPRLDEVEISPRHMHEGPIEIVYPDGTLSRDIYTALSNTLAMLESVYYTADNKPFGYAAQLMTLDVAVAQMRRDE